MAYDNPKVNGIDFTAIALFDVITESTTSRTLSTDDGGTYIRCTNASPVTITVPTDATGGWSTELEILIEQAGNGQVTVSAAVGVTINTSETLKTEKQYSVIGLKRVGSDTWTLFGERELL